MAYPGQKYCSKKCKDGFKSKASAAMDFYKSFKKETTDGEE
jgi:hypothetical protein